MGESSPADSGRAENLNRVPAESVCARSGARERAALHVVRPLGLGTEAAFLDRRLAAAENLLVRFCQRNEYVAKLSTGPSTPTPTPAPTVTTCTASAPQPMTSFTADPATITNGDTFTLRWAAPCGFVSLAQKGRGPFMILLPSTGSYALRTGLDGYPTATGNTVYEARNADTATPREATVTVNAAATPTPAPNRPPTVSVAPSASTCHPPSPTIPCTVTCTAAASDPDGDALSYAWSGCASGAAAAATCTVSKLKDFTCSVNVSDGRGGTATASATVTGTNLAPQEDTPYCYPTDNWWEGWVYPNRTDAFVSVRTKNDDPGDVITCTLLASSGSGCTNVGLGSNCTVDFTSGAAGTSCQFQVKNVDAWGAGFTADVPVAVHN